MPRRVYSFDRPDRFICGALGQPGQRTFFIQASKGEQIVSVALEKAQVAVLAERLATLLLAVQRGGVAIGEETSDAPQQLREPVVEQFRVGTMTLGWDSEAEKVVIEAREIGADDVEDDDADDVEDDDEDDDEEDDEDDDEEDDEPPGGAVGLASLAVDPDDERDVVRVQLEPQAALEFATGALAVIRAGRPPCPQCGAPLEPTGHFCVRRNGYAN